MQVVFVDSKPVVRYEEIDLTRTDVKKEYAVVEVILSKVCVKSGLGQKLQVI